MTILNDPKLERLLDRLHQRSDAQTSAIQEHYAERDRAIGRAPEDQAALTKTFLEARSSHYYDANPYRQNNSQIRG
jgi:hypothetical protein